MRFIDRVVFTYRASRTNRILWFVLAICLLYLVSNEIYLMYLKKSYPADYIDAQFAPLTSKYGIKIVYEIGDGFLSPLTRSIIPAGPGRGSKILSIRHRVLLAYPPILLRALGKYPVSVIKEHLKAIHFAEEIDENGFKYGGAYDPFRKIIFLVDNGCKSDDLKESVFHHEFSSLLLKSRSLLLNPWFDQNPDGFVYRGNRANSDLESDTDSCIEGAEKNYENGFVSCYGQTYFENDFNEYSALIFTHPQKFKQIMDRHPRVRGKFLVWLKFYQEIDPVFTEAYLFGEE